MASLIGASQAFARDPAFAAASACRGESAPCAALNPHIKRLQAKARGRDDSAWKARFVWGSVLAAEARRSGSKSLAAQAVEVLKPLSRNERHRFADDARYEMARLRWMRGDRARAKRTLRYLLCQQVPDDMQPKALALLRQWGGKTRCGAAVMAGAEAARRKAEVAPAKPVALEPKKKPKVVASPPRGSRGVQGTVVGAKVARPSEPGVGAAAARPAKPSPAATKSSASETAAQVSSETASRPTGASVGATAAAPNPSPGKAVKMVKPAAGSGPVRRIRRIVIDPGHGGNDPGALGRGGIREADLAYDLSVSFAEELRKRGYTVLMTRNRSNGRRLRERAAYANRHHADLFISVHLNAAKRRAYGFEVYTLDVGGDSYSRRLAARENAQTEEEVDRLRYILADLATKGNAEDSRALAKAVASSVDGFRTNRKKELRSALFAVLLGARMPAILIEAGFVTDSDDVKRLKSDKRRRATARYLADGIDAFARALAAQGR